MSAAVPRTGATGQNRKRGETLDVGTREQRRRIQVETGTGTAGDVLMGETEATNTVEQSRRLLRRPTTAETERIARACPSASLTVRIIVAAIQRETGCSRATAYRAVADALAAGIFERNET